MSYFSRNSQLPKHREEKKYQNYLLLWLFSNSHFDDVIIQNIDRRWQVNKCVHWRNFMPKCWVHPKLFKKPTEGGSIPSPKKNTRRVKNSKKIPKISKTLINLIRLKNLKKIPKIPKKSHKSQKNPINPKKSHKSHKSHKS